MGGKSTKTSRSKINELLKKKMLTPEEYDILLRENPFYLTVGDKDSSYLEPGVQRYRGRNRDVHDIEFQSEADAHTVAKLSGQTDYIISEGEDKNDWHKKPVFKSKSVIDYETESTKDSDDYNATMNETVARIAASSRNMVLWTYGRHILYAQRGKPSYDSHRSLRLRLMTSMFVTSPGRRRNKIYPDRFMTSNGKFQRKKFMDDLAWYFGGKRSERSIPSRYDRRMHQTFAGRDAVPGNYPLALEILAEQLPDILIDYNRKKKQLWSNPKKRR